MKIYAIFDEKAKSRERNYRKLLKTIPKKTKFRVLIHSASMGEYEQAKPIIEEIKKLLPNCEIISSFFSPSGYENQKNYELSDYSVYMPIDTFGNAKEFVRVIQPDIALFVRYDLWLNTLIELNKINCNSYLICASKPSDKSFNKYKIYTQYAEMCYEQYSKILTVSDLQSEYFKSLNISTNLSTLSDTRSDRILNLAEKSRNKPLLPYKLLENAKNLVAGSSWQPDEEIISEAVNSINAGEFRIRVIYAPHEPKKENIERIRSYHQNTILLSELLSRIEKNSMDAQELAHTHIIVDSIGKLLALYANADYAYVGGGFGVSVHSVSEPAGYGVPIITGANISKMPDSVFLTQANSQKIINNSDELKSYLIKLIDDSDFAIEIGKKNRKFIEDSAGSSKTIAKLVYNEYKLKNGSK